MSMDFIQTLIEIVPAASIIVTAVGAAVTAWSFARTRRAYYDEFRQRRDD